MPDRSGPGSRSRVGPAPRRLRALLLAGLGLVLLFLLFVAFAGLWTDWLWFRSVHYSSVFTGRLRTRTGLFAVFGLLMAVTVGANSWLAYRLRPPLAAMSVEQQSLDRYRLSVAPYRRRLLLASSLAIGLAAGAAASGQWRTWLLWTHQTPFGVRDGQFHLDVAFYTFSLPWYEFLLGFAFSVVIVSILAAVLVHYLYGGLRLQGPGQRVSSGARGHLSVLLGLFVLLKAVAYWLDRYGLAVRSSSYKGLDGWTGLRYVDANAFLPARTILFFVAIICGALLLLTPIRRTWVPGLIGLGVMALSAMLIGGVYPAIVQQLQVKPNEEAKEAPYIQKNIDATRQAYGIADSQTQSYDPNGSTTADALRPDAQTIADIRLLDPNMISPAFQQYEQQRSYYSFPQTLNVDRYPTTAGVQDTVIGVRELNLNGMQQHNWINDHFKYTHGYGVVAAKGNQVDALGLPVFTESGLPSTGSLGDYQQRVYYGEQTTDYAIVGGSNQEIDYTADGGDRTYRYTGAGGVSLDDPLTRAAYAVRFGDAQILYSSAITKGAGVIYDRTPKERVEKVAPWLSIDADPYPVVQDGRLVWVLDGYTTSDSYPFSTKTTLGDATRDSLTDQRGSTLAAVDTVNYIRDSVKATVDAYTGKVTLYQWDEQDPVLRTWMKAFPGTVRPRSEIPAGLLPHLRYPQDLFKVQRDLLGMYHVTDADAFFNGTDIWQVPADPTTTNGDVQPPYYLTLRMPGTQAAGFSLTSSFTPSGRDNLAAFMAVGADPGPDYGKIRILRVAGGGTALGPQQAQSKFTSDKTVANELTLLKNGGDSKVEYGNLLTLPVGGGLLNVEPVYVQGRGAPYPVLQKVLAVYGNDNAALADNLGEALGMVFGDAAAAVPAMPTAPAGPGSTPTVPVVSPGGGAAVQQALQDAQQAFTAGQDALKRGDWTGYGQEQKALRDALQRATDAARKPAGVAPGAAPSPARP